MTMNMGTHNASKKNPTFPNELLFLIFAKVDDLGTFTACACINIHWRSVLMGHLWKRRVKRFYSITPLLKKKQLDTLEEVLSGKDTYKWSIDTYLAQLLVNVGDCNLKFLNIGCNNDILFQVIRLNNKWLENLKITCNLSPYKVMEFFNIVGESRIITISIQGPLQVYRLFSRRHDEHVPLQFPVLKFVYIHRLQSYYHHQMNFMKFILERSPHLKTFIIGQCWSPDQYEIDEIHSFMPASLLKTFTVFVNTQKQICFLKKY